MRVPFAKVDCDGNELRYVREVLESGWLTTAGKTLEFEKRFARVVAGRQACAVNSCTAALHLALEAVGVGPGDQVLVPTLTFTATAEIVRYLGADPVFLDVEYGTGLLTPEIVEAALKRYPRAKAVIVVHFAGQAAQMLPPSSSLIGGQVSVVTSPPPISPRSVVSGPVVAHPLAIVDICRQQGVRIIEDAAHAFPTRLNGRMIGSFGDATCFSFYANKTITTGEGGMLVTDDEAIYARAKIMRLHGINRDIWDRFTSEKSAWEYDVVAPGFKYNMPDINAAIGLAQLERAESMRQERQRCFEYYLEHLAGIECLDLPIIRGRLEEHSCHLFWVVLTEGNEENEGRGRTEGGGRKTEDGARKTDKRNGLIESLAAAGIGTSVHYKPLHRMTYYRERYGLKPEDFPNAERHWQGCVSLPVYPSLTNDELGYIVRKVKEGVEESRKQKAEIEPRRH